MSFELESVTVERQGRAILDAVSCTFAAPVTVVTGPSGGGKTTLLRLFNGLASADAGTVRYDGKDVAAWVPRQLRREVGFVAQQPSAIAETGREELALAIALTDSKATIDEAVGFATAMDLGDDHLDRDPSELSVGERQRLAIARALAGRPKVLVLDEPTSGQDAERARKVHGLLAEQVRGGMKLIIVEHKLDALELYGDAARVTLEAGKVIA